MFCRTHSVLRGSGLGATTHCGPQYMRCVALHAQVCYQLRRRRAAGGQVRGVEEGGEQRSGALQQLPVRT